MLFKFFFFFNNYLKEKETKNEPKLLLENNF